MHYIVEGNIGRGQAADHAREEEGHRHNRVKGDKMGRKHQGIMILCLLSKFEI